MSYDLKAPKMSGATTVHVNEQTKKTVFRKEILFQSQIVTRVLELCRIWQPKEKSIVRVSQRSKRQNLFYSTLIDLTKAPLYLK